MSASIQDILREHYDMPNSQIIAHYHENTKRIYRIEQLERELAEAKAKIKSMEWMCQHAQDLRNAIAETDDSIMGDDELVAQPAKMKAELSALKEQKSVRDMVDGKICGACDHLKKRTEYEDQIAKGELISPQTIHDFLDTKHDRWNPLFMRDLVEFAAERQRRGNE